MEIKMDIKKARYIAYTAYRSYENLAQLIPNVFLEDNENEHKSNLELKIKKEILQSSANIILDIVNPIFEEFPEIEEEIKQLVKEYKVMP